MTKTKTTNMVLAVSAQHYDPFADPKNSVYSLTAWQGAGNTLRVCIRLNGKVLGDKLFRDCETQHSDSERWLNDKVGYPNPFAGVLLARAWE